LALSSATHSAEAVTALLALLKDPSERVRSSAALALSSATHSAEVVTALLALLKDPSEIVRSRVAEAIHELLKRSSFDEFQNLPEELIHVLASPGLENFVFSSQVPRRAYDLIFDSLIIIAPYPRV
jgi:uncharacterized protein (DUF2336 family)